MIVKRYSTMSEENKRVKCPVCGRFCKQEAVDRYNGLLNERNRLAKELDGIAEELGVAKQNLVEARESLVKVQKYAEDTETLYINAKGKADEAIAENKRLQDKLSDAGVKMAAMNNEMNDLRNENERLRNRGFWQRVFNK